MLIEAGDKYIDVPSRVIAAEHLTAVVQYLELARRMADMRLELDTLPARELSLARAAATEQAQRELQRMLETARQELARMLFATVSSWTEELRTASERLATSVTNVLVAELRKCAVGPNGDAVAQQTIELAAAELSGKGELKIVSSPGASELVARTAEATRARHPHLRVAIEIDKNVSHDAFMVVCDNAVLSVDLDAWLKEAEGVLRERLLRALHATVPQPGRAGRALDSERVSEP